MREPTPIEVWAPAFHWLELERVNANNTQSVTRDGARCKLCENPVAGALPAREKHATEHRRELREWRRRNTRAQQRENTARLRTINRLRKEGAASATPTDPEPAELEEQQQLTV